MSFTPDFKPYSGIGKLRFWCQKVLPLVYDDSLSYYELLNKIVAFLNETIEDVGNVEDNLAALRDAFTELEQYVADQIGTVAPIVEEVIDQMVESGQFGDILVDAMGDVIAEEYDPEKSYNPLNYVLKDGDLYCCTSPTTGEWDSDDWRKTSVGDELNTLMRKVYLLKTSEVTNDSTVTGATAKDALDNLQNNKVPTTNATEISFQHEQKIGELADRRFFVHVKNADGTYYNYFFNPPPADEDENIGFDVATTVEVNVLKSLVAWESGTIDPQGEPQSSTSRIRTNHIYGIDSTKDINIAITGSYDVNCAWYYHDTYLSTDEYDGDRIVHVPSNANNVVILCKHVNDTTIDPSEGTNILFGIVPRIVNEKIASLHASGIINDSSVSGTNVDDALDFLLTNKVPTTGATEITFAHNQKIGELADRRLFVHTNNINGKYYNYFFPAPDSNVTDSKGFVIATDQDIGNVTQYKTGDSVPTAGFYSGITNASADTLSMMLTTHKAIPQNATFTLATLPNWIRGSGLASGNGDFSFTLKSMSRLSEFAIEIDFNIVAGNGVTVPAMTVFEVFFSGGSVTIA